MKLDNILIMVFLCTLFAWPSCGAEEDKKNGDVIIPPGMETIKEGNVEVVVPKGGQLRKQGSVMLIETADEYASRKFSDTEEHFKRIEKELEAQKKELEDLRKTIGRMELKKDGRENQPR